MFSSGTTGLPFDKSKGATGLESGAAVGYEQDGDKEDAFWVETTAITKHAHIEKLT